jgi:hypothetical protein
MRNGGKGRRVGEGLMLGKRGRIKGKEKGKG